MSDHKNIFSIIQTKLQSVSVAVKHLELHGDSVELEELLKNLEGMNTTIKRRLDALSNLDTRSSEKSAIACPTFKRTRSTKYALIGPQGIGKSRYAIRLAKALVATRIFDEGHDWPEDLESAFVANTLLISNHTNFQPDANTIVFRVQDTSDLLLLVSDLEATPFDPWADGPDFFKGTKIGDVGAIMHSTSKKQAPGHVIGVYPSSIRVRWQAAEKCAFETTFFRQTGMSKRAQLSFDPIKFI